LQGDGALHLKIERHSCCLRREREDNVFASRALSQGLFDEGSQCQAKRSCRRQANLVKLPAGAANSFLG